MQRPRHRAPLPVVPILPGRGHPPRIASRCRTFGSIFIFFSTTTARAISRPPMMAGPATPVPPLQATITPKAYSMPAIARWTKTLSYGWPPAVHSRRFRSGFAGCWMASISTVAVFTATGRTIPLVLPLCMVTIILRNAFGVTSLLTFFWRRRKSGHIMDQLVTPITRAPSHRRATGGMLCTKPFAILALHRTGYGR